MSYGSKDWAAWVQEEEEAFKHIKAAYDAGIQVGLFQLPSQDEQDLTSYQTFNTANVYSNGVSETILGKAIKKFNLPREEIVIMTKVGPFRSRLL